MFETFECCTSYGHTLYFCRNLVVDGKITSLSNFVRSYKLTNVCLWFPTLSRKIFLLLYVPTFLCSPCFLIQDAAPHLSNDSSVVIVSSIAAYQPPASMAMYGVTKTALLALTKALAAEMAPNTRVNCIAPGFVPTHFADFLMRNTAIKKAIEEKTLLNRLGTTEDMAAATAFLASDDAAYITGETLVVAGGTPSRL